MIQNILLNNSYEKEKDSIVEVKGKLKIKGKYFLPRNTWYA